MEEVSVRHQCNPAARSQSCGIVLTALVLLASLFSSSARGDEPYARNRDYDLQNARIHLRFDLDNRKVMGETTQTLASLRDGVAELKFDSGALEIESVTVNGSAAKFRTTPEQLIVSLARPAQRGEKFAVTIRYNGQPKKGLYFVAPDKNYSDRPKQVWSQGESEDTHFYIPIYDYPNDRMTSEMLLTVPANWLTISNGKLVGVKSEADGMKTWDWRQSQPHSTYLISVVAGEYTETKDTWRGMPVEYVVPRGSEKKIAPTFRHTKQMLDLFSDKLGVRYPWDKYAQSVVDDFVVGGMENTSATTLTTRGLQNPELAPESAQGSDGLISHEMAHQWFGDLVTCKDWSNLWLNEGFATYFEHLWTESGYGNDAVEYEFWQDRNDWFRQQQLYTTPIVARELKDQLRNGGNIYTKGGWVLHMLRERLGDENFFRAMHHYLDTYRGQNVVTGDLAKAVEQATATSVDEFFDQWVYGAGAPRFAVSSTYDAAGNQVKLEVKQTQKVEGRVGLFHVPIEVEITTASGRKSFPIDVSRASEIFPFPVDGPPQMVLFDKGNKILKSAEFRKSPQELVYQLKNAEAVPDRANAAQALAEVKDNADAAAALGDAALHDSFWGVRGEALRALGKIGDAAAQKQIEAALANEQPWVREIAVEQLGQFKGNKIVAIELEKIYREDKAYRVRGAALGALAKVKAPDALDILEAAAKSESPDDTLRVAALRAMGELGDDKAVPLLLDWSAPGKPFDTRRAAIAGLAQLDKKNKEITRKLAEFVGEPYISVRLPAIFALGRRGDPDGIAPLEALIKSGQLSIGLVPLVEGQIQQLKAQTEGKPPGPANEAGAADGQSGKDTGEKQVLEALEKLQRQIAEMSERLQKIEGRLAAEKK